MPESCDDAGEDEWGGGILRLLKFVEYISVYCELVTDLEMWDSDSLCPAQRNVLADRYSCHVIPPPT